VELLVDLAALEFYFLLMVMDIIIPVVVVVEVGQHREAMVDLAVAVVAQRVVHHQVGQEEVPDRVAQVEILEQQVQPILEAEQRLMVVMEVQIPVAAVVPERKVMFLGVLILMVDRVDRVL
jgi:hypothetical protein